LHLPPQPGTPWHHMGLAKSSKPAADGTTVDLYLPKRPPESERSGHARVFHFDSGGEWRDT
jgi:hypothetical protein